MATEKQITANRENAQHSTGPVTPEGKASSSHNAVKTGLTGQTVLLKTDDVEAYNRRIQRFNDKIKPATDEQRSLVQDLALGRFAYTGRNITLPRVHAECDYMLAIQHDDRLQVEVCLTKLGNSSIRLECLRRQRNLRQPARVGLSRNLVRAALGERLLRIHKDRSRTVSLEIE